MIQPDNIRFNVSLFCLKNQAYQFKLNATKVYIYNLSINTTKDSLEIFVIYAWFEESSEQFSNK